jgi:hypothetical protein
VLKPTFIKDVFFDIIFNDTPYDIVHKNGYRFMWVLREPNACDNISDVFKHVYGQMGILAFINANIPNYIQPVIKKIEYDYSDETQYVVSQETVDRFISDIKDAYANSSELEDINKKLESNKCMMCVCECDEKINTCCCLRVVCKQCFVPLTYMQQCISCTAKPKQIDWYYRHMRYLL